MSRLSLRACLDVAIRAAHQAGPLLVERLGRPFVVETKRSDIDLVTEVDRASERIIHDRIHRRFPDHGILGEEHPETNPDAPYRWLVDPLDGTTNFVHGIPTFGISIALWHRATPLVGLVYDPTRRELFTAIAGQGARLNGRRIHVSRRRSLSASLLSTGFSVKFRQNPALYLRWFQAFESRCHAVRRMGSTALSLAYVACGRQEGFYEHDLWPWDIAAGILLVQEAGGRVTDFHGGAVRVEGNDLVASNRWIHPQILQHLAPSRYGRSRRASTSRWLV